VEGLVFAIVKKNTIAPDHVFDVGYDYKEVCNIKPSVLGTADNVHLYRKNKKNLKIADDGATFGRLNLFLKHKGLVTEQQYKTLNWIRAERNRLHIQGLNGSDTNYTNYKVRRTAKAIRFLMTKV
jgi:hypothetical protein